MSSRSEFGNRFDTRAFAQIKRGGSFSVIKTPYGKRSVVLIKTMSNAVLAS